MTREVVCLQQQVIQFSGSNVGGLREPALKQPMLGSAHVRVVLYELKYNTSISILACNFLSSPA